MLTFNDIRNFILDSKKNNAGNCFVSQNGLNIPISGVQSIDNDVYYINAENNTLILVREGDTLGNASS